MITTTRTPEGNVTEYSLEKIARKPAAVRLTVTMDGSTNEHYVSMDNLAESVSALLSCGATVLMEPIFGGKVVCKTL